MKKIGTPTSPRLTIQDKGSPVEGDPGLSAHVDDQDREGGNDSKAVQRGLPAGDLRREFGGAASRSGWGPEDSALAVAVPVVAAPAVARLSGRGPPGSGACREFTWHGSTKGRIVR